MQSARKYSSESVPLLVVAIASLETQLITLGLRRFIAPTLQLYKCSRLSDSFYGRVAAATVGGCTVIRDGIPARSKGCAQGRTMAERRQP